MQKILEYQRICEKYFSEEKIKTAIDHPGNYTVLRIKCKLLHGVIIINYLFYLVVYV